MFLLPKGGNMTAINMSTLASSSRLDNDYWESLELLPFIETIGVRCKILKLSQKIINSSDRIYELINSFTTFEEQGKIRSYRLVTQDPLHSYLIVEFP